MPLGMRVGDELHARLEDARRTCQAVFGAAEHERRRLDVLPVIDHRVEVRHLPEKRLHHRVPRPVGAQRPCIANLRILVELRSPRRWIVREVSEDAGVNLLIGRAEVALVGFVDAAPRPLVARIEEADGIVDDDALGDVGILGGESGCQHAAHRVTDDERLVDLQLLKQQARVARHVVEVVRNDRLRRPPEPDLIRARRRGNLPFEARRWARPNRIRRSSCRERARRSGRLAGPAPAHPCRPSGCPARRASRACTTRDVDTAHPHM